MPADYETLDVAVEGDVATLRLNRPGARNALNLAMCREIALALQAMRDASRVVLVKAAGPVFCAGADLKERQHMSEAEAVARRVAAFGAYAAIEAMPQPVIAVVDGAAVGSGCEIATACDFVIASTRATFRYPEVAWGTVGATQRLPRIVGPRMAKELLWTGRTLAAPEARQLGLVNVMVDPEALDAAVATMAARIAAAPPLAVRLAKRCIDKGVDNSREAAMAIELHAIEENMRHSDWKAAIARFGHPRRDDR